MLQYKHKNSQTPIFLQSPRQGFGRLLKDEAPSEEDEEGKEDEEEAWKPTSPHGDDAPRNEGRRRQTRVHPSRC